MAMINVAVWTNFEAQRRGAGDQGFRVGTRRLTVMSRPEFSGPPELFYNEDEANKYTCNTRIMEVQAEMSIRAIELLEIDDPSSALILDIGCGSCISGTALTDEGFPWIGMDISEHMLAAGRQHTGAEEDLVLADMGAGLPFMHGSFDGAISISAIQWLCHANRSNEKPVRRIHTFFQSLFSCLASGARAVFQFYPESNAQAELIRNQAVRAGFGGGLVVDFPESQRKKKVYLVVMTSGIQRLPKALCEDEEEEEGNQIDNAGRRTFNTGRKPVDRARVRGTKEWIERKKERQRIKGMDVKTSSKYTGRRRKRAF